MPFDALAAAAVVVAVAAVAGRGCWELLFTLRIGTGARFPRALALDALLDRGVAKVTEELAARAGYAAADRDWRYLLVICDLLDR
jgi:hypothetical protein